MQDSFENAGEEVAANPAADVKDAEVGNQGALTAPSTNLPAISLTTDSDWPASDLPRPTVLNEASSFIWDDDAPQAANYIELGRRLAKSGDLFRNPQHGAGLLLASASPAIPPVQITKGARLAPIIVDRLIVAVIKKGKPAGTQIPSKQLDVMLASEVFLQQFPPLDAVVTTPMYLRDFSLVHPGYNNAGPGERIYFVGESATIEAQPTAINSFLNEMAFATNADRTNAVAAALTVMLWNHWPGAKPIILTTATKSHAGKDTIIAFATGSAGSVSVSYQAANWAFERSFVGAIKTTPSTAVVVIENARLDRRDRYIASAFIERFVTDPEPFLFSTGTGSPVRVTNKYVLAISTNFGLVSNDIMNRALPIHLEPIGDVHRRESAIGNPKLEFLPANRDRIEAELRGMIEHWKTEGQPLDQAVKHPFTDWARTVGGILKVAGFTDFLGNYDLRKSEDDPLRHALGLLGAARPNVWLRTNELVLVVAELGLNRLIPEADRGSPEGQRRGLGVLLSAHHDETFQVETEDEIIKMQLKKSRKRFDGNQPSTRYMFEVLHRQALPEDCEPHTGGEEAAGAGNDV